VLAGFVEKTHYGSRVESDCTELKFCSAQSLELELAFEGRIAY